MPLIKDEQDVKKTSQFLKYESGEEGNTLIIKSHLYQINSHFIKSVSRSVECRSEECLYCQAGYQKRTEYNYMVFMNGQDGFIDIKPSIFFAIQGIARAQKKDVRQISWTVIKKGEGLNTDYITSKDDNLSDGDYKNLLENLEENTNKLVAAMQRHEEDLSSNYTTYMTDIRAQKESGSVDPDAFKKANEAVAKAQNAKENAAKSGTIVDPSDIPF